MCYGGCDCQRCNPEEAMTEPIQEAVLVERGLYEQVVEGLRVIGMETYCDGPGCGWCESDNRHPFTENAKEAQRLLTQLEAHKEKG